MKLSNWFKSIFCKKILQKIFLAKRGPFWVPVTPSTMKFWNFFLAKGSSMFVGSVSIRGKIGSDLHRTQKDHQKWPVGPILGRFGLFWVILSYLELWLCAFVSIFVIHENWEWDKWYRPLFLKKKFEKWCVLPVFSHFLWFWAIFGHF